MLFGLGLESGFEGLQQVVQETHKKAEASVAAFEVQESHADVPISMTL